MSLLCAGACGLRVQVTDYTAPDNRVRMTGLTAERRCAADPPGLKRQALHVVLHRRRSPCPNNTTGKPVKSLTDRDLRVPRISSDGKGKRSHRTRHRPVRRGGPARCQSDFRCGLPCGPAQQHARQRRTAFTYRLFAHKKIRIATRMFASYRASCRRSLQDDRAHHPLLVSRFASAAGRGTPLFARNRRVSP